MINNQSSTINIDKELLSLVPDPPPPASVSQSGQIINIAGENFLLPQEPVPAETQNLVLTSEQAQQLLMAQQHQQQQQLVLEPVQHQQQQQQLLIEPLQQQQMMVSHQQQEQQSLFLSHLEPQEQQQQQQLLIEPGQQHIFLDEHGRQVILDPGQQLQLLQQYDDGSQLVQEDVIDPNQLQLQPGGLDNQLQLQPGSLEDQLVQLEGANGERVMLSIPSEHNQLLFQAQEEGMEF